MMSEKELNKSAPEEEKGTEATSQAAAESQKESDGETASAEPAAEAAEPEEGASAAEEGSSAEPNWKDMYARMLADFDNYRKRVSRDREELVKFAASETVKDMLVTADNLALALGQAKDPEDPFVKGDQLAYESFLKALKDHGAEPFESVGEELDPNRHEAIATLPSDSIEEGKISTEVKKGWMLNGRLLRAAQVVVSSGPAK
jgi:molecular chaperone GrpE